jgi:hypothetical protein
MAGEQQQVTAALAQRRQAQLDHAQPEQQVLAEGTGGDRRREVAMGGRQHPHVDRHGAAPTERLDHPLLQHPQQLGLRGGRHVADLVQEEGAAIGLPQLAGAVAVGAGEGATQVAEELALDQRLRDGGAVDRHEWRAGARRESVEAPRHQFLAGAGLAQDQHAHRRRRDALDGVGQLVHGGRLAEQQPVSGEAPHLLGEHPVLALQAGGLQRLFDDEAQLVDLVGLREVVGGARLDRRDGGAQRGVGGHHDHRRRSGERHDVSERRHPVHARHPQVEKHQVDAMTRPQETVDALAARRALDEIVGGGAQGPRRTPPRHRLVVADQQPRPAPGRRAPVVRCHCASSAGETRWTRTLKTMRPGSLSTSISPPRSCSRRATRARPRPVP